jgi:cytochrome d ubiquinol oxidase subunit II
MTLADVAAFAMLGGLVIYALTGGADFGGGLWDLLAFGRRAPEQRKLIERALAPIWEANHVWLIFVVVVLFTAFPTAYSVASISLHIPLTAMLIGIVLRGSAFVFRQYGGGSAVAQLRWGRVFAVASVLTPIFLGVTVGAITSGEIRVIDGEPSTGYLAGWIGLFPLAAGLFTLALFGFLAAVYLCVEAGAGERELQEDFRARALAAGIALAPLAALAALTAGPGTRHFADALLGSPWTLPHQLSTGLTAVGTLAALWVRRYRLARVLAAAQVTLILVGWALAQRPYLIAPDVTIEHAAAPPVTLELMLVIVGAGALLLIPSLYYLFRVFRKVS